MVTRNRAEPTQTSPSPSGAPCPGGDCPFALAMGGGIASWGDLTLRRVVVSDNVSGGIASDADGAGIASADGKLVVRTASSAATAPSRASPTGASPRAAACSSPAARPDDRQPRPRQQHGADQRAPALPAGRPEDRPGEPQRRRPRRQGRARRHRAHVRSWTTRRRCTTPRAGGWRSRRGLLVLTAPFELRDSVVERQPHRGRGGRHRGRGLHRDARSSSTAAAPSPAPASRTTPSGAQPGGIAAATSGLAVYSFADDPQPAMVRDSVISHNTAEATSETGRQRYRALASSTTRCSRWTACGSATTSAPPRPRRGSSRAAASGTASCSPARPSSSPFATRS